MRTEKIGIYTFGELSDEAKEKARQWYRDWSMDDEWWDFEDFTAITECLGFEISMRLKTYSRGESRQALMINWQGFSTQGSGASFSAIFRIRDGLRAPQRILEYCNDEKLIGIAGTLAEACQKFIAETGDYMLDSAVKIKQSSSRYCHENTMFSSGELLNDVSYAMGDKYPDDDLELRDACDDLECAVLDEAKNLARWLYRSLEDEYNYRNSDEAVDESILENNHEFYADGGNH